MVIVPDAIEAALYRNVFCIFLSLVEQVIQDMSFTVLWAANKSFETSKFEFKLPRARTFELLRARSRLYRSQILQVNTRWNSYLFRKED